MKLFQDYVPEAKKIADAKSDSGTTYHLEWVLVELAFNDLASELEGVQKESEHNIVQLDVLTGVVNKMSDALIGAEKRILELEEKYCEVAVKRLAQEVLF